MILGMQDFDFCPNRIKFYQIYPNFTQFLPNLTQFIQIGLNFAQIYLKKFARRCDHSLHLTPLEASVIKMQ